MRGKLGSLAVLAAVSLLSACGGGSDGTPSTVAVAPTGSATSTATTTPAAASNPSAAASSPSAAASSATGSASGGTTTPAPTTTNPAPARSAYELAVDAADAKRREAEALAVDGPCETDNQCGTLTFDPTTIGPMSTADWLDYSLVSPTAAAAGAAAADYNVLARAARDLAPPDNSVCACTSNVTPTRLRCVNRKCVRGSAFEFFDVQPIDATVTATGSPPQ